MQKDFKRQIISFSKWQSQIKACVNHDYVGGVYFVSMMSELILTESIKLLGVHAVQFISIVSGKKKGL